MTPKRVAQEIAWERWRLRFELANVARAQTVAGVNHSQANADSALRALVRLGCDEAAELKAATS